MVLFLPPSNSPWPQDGHPPLMRPPQPQVTCLHHEQTVAVVSLTPDNIVTRFEEY